ncbi:MAG: hypothetical protein IPN74_16100 [Haliscomenobacter sp.]|nr:hypothetical protein [Haliscomenobacter sp.]MBK8880000.1 hypothetical protein [Haliscomenobacter sp.]
MGIFMQGALNAGRKPCQSPLVKDTAGYHQTDSGASGWKSGKGLFQILVGASSKDIRLKESIYRTRSAFETP